MSNNKRYFWLKLMKDFFVQARIKKLRRIAGGDTYVIIYLKLMLLSINSEGIIVFESIEETLEEELALILDEDITNIKVLISYLFANKLCKQISENEFKLNEVNTLIGSESSSTQRSRKSRESKKVLQCNTNATNCNTEKEKEIEEEKYEKLNEFLLLKQVAKDKREERLKQIPNKTIGQNSDIKNNLSTNNSHNFLDKNSCQIQEVKI